MNELLKTQLWVNRDNYPLDEKFFQKVSNEGSFGKMGVKGFGGLWTSTFLGEEKGSEWIQWSIGNDFLCPKNNKWNGYLLEIKNDTKVYTIDSLTDMHILFDNYGYEWIPLISQEGIDFEKMAKDYDAIHLTSKGQAITRHGFSFFEPEEDLKDEWKEKRMRNFYGWDCESTYHFRWNFKTINPITLEIKKEDIA